MQVADVDTRVERGQHIVLRQRAGGHRDRRHGFLVIGAIGRDAEFLCGPGADQAARMTARVDQRDGGRSGEAGFVEHRRHATGGVLAERDERR